MRSRLLLAVALLFAVSAAIRAEPPSNDTNITFEIRIFTVAAETPLGPCPMKEGEVAFLTDAQLSAILKSAQGDRRVNVMQAPKVTTFNGQEAELRIADQHFFVTGLDAQRANGQTILVPKKTTLETGLTLSVRGQVSVETNFVAVNVSYFVKRLAEKVEMIPVVTQITPVFEGGSQGKPVPFTQYLQAPQIETMKIEKKDLKIPSGGHAAIAGPVFLQESRTETSIPVLAEIPYLNRLFTNVGYSKTKMRTVLVVSPRVIEVMDEAPMPPKVKAER